MSIGALQGRVVVAAGRIDVAHGNLLTCAKNKIIQIDEIDPDTAVPGTPDVCERQGVAGRDDGEGRYGRQPTIGDVKVLVEFENETLILSEREAGVGAQQDGGRGNFRLTDTCWPSTQAKEMPRALRFQVSRPAVEVAESVPTVNSVPPTFRTVPSGSVPPDTVRLRESPLMVFPLSDVFRLRETCVTVYAVGPRVNMSGARTPKFEPERKPKL